MVTLLKGNSRDQPRDWENARIHSFSPSPKQEPNGDKKSLAETQTATRVPDNTVDDREIARFTAMADSWWDPNGNFKPLHRLNPARIGYLRDRLSAHFSLDAKSLTPFSDLRILDIGCGGGLLSEPMARLGAEVVGADAGEANIRVAALHAAQAGLEIDYRHTTAEVLAKAGEQFDVIVNMEVIEHVADVEMFLSACARLLATGGAMALSTLNRTPKSYMAAIVGAEYLLRWLPRGTHDWQKFVKPSELSRALDGAGLALKDIQGLIYNPLSQSWSLGRDTGINYVGFAVPVGETDKN